MNRSLEEELKRNLRGDVLFDDASRALYAADASNYRQIPIGVVRPKDASDVEKTLALCRKHGAPVLSRGAGTSLAGQCCNAAVILDFKKSMNRILEIDPVKGLARVQPGVVLDDLRDAVRKYGLTFGPDPATHNRCTFGGMIGNNACGVHSVIAGKTSDNVEELEVVTYDGLKFRIGRTSKDTYKEILSAGGRRAEIYKSLNDLVEKYAGLIRSRFPRLPRRVSGYNLDELLPEKDFNVARALVGTEGTCAVVLEAVLRLIPDPAHRCLLVAGFDDVYAAADHVPVVLQYKPIGIEGLDSHFVKNMRSAGLHLKDLDLFPPGDGWLIIEFGGASALEAESSAQKLMKFLQTAKAASGVRLFTSAAEQKQVWQVRESSFGATVFVPGIPDTFSGFEDSAVPPERLGAYLRDLQKLYDRYGFYAVTYGHFGDGCIHSRISFDLKTEGGIQIYRRFMEEASDLVVRFGGSFSGEHGDGQNWGEFLPKMYGPELVDAFWQFKKIWDPENKMNPGKVLAGYKSDENLRLKPYETISEPPLHFHFGDGNFARTTERCIGIGKCLKKDTDIMCPSYMATEEEKHSTRGRAHLLHEMMRGEVVKGGWADEGVKESLDLCLACKGCKTECPVGVDMASYKAEFLSQYYKRKPRPVNAFLFGWIAWWARLAGFWPAAANFLMQAPLLKPLLKKIAGIAPERELPLFSSQTFKQWFNNRGRGSCPETSHGCSTRVSAPMGALFPATRGNVILWPDTFNNYFYPQSAQAAVEVLESLGYAVKIPRQDFCCGRPLYDFGMLDLAKKFLQDIMAGLKSEIENGVPLICLEPSCASVFKDELKQLFPSDPLAQKLSKQVYLLAEFLAPDAALLKDKQKISAAGLLHGHCHQKSLDGMAGEEKILSVLGLDVKIAKAGCCGMAGAFGFEKEHYKVSVKIGDLALMPAVRRAGPSEEIVTDGFSCREQVRQMSGRRPLHLAELLKKVLGL